MTEFESSVEKTGPREKEIERIQKKLEQFVSKEVARETAMWIYALALDVDQEIGRILQDPQVLKLYEYDGQFFTPRSGGGFHRAFDGIHVLQSLTNSTIETFFYGKGKKHAIQSLMNDLGQDSWSAKIRRMNWEEYHTLNSVPEQVVAEIIKDYRERTRQAEEPPPLSVEEFAFFQFYEEEMRTLDSNERMPRTRK